jgi:hypothetical protein
MAIQRICSSGMASNHCAYCWQWRAISQTAKETIVPAFHNNTVLFRILMIRLVLAFRRQRRNCTDYQNPAVEKKKKTFADVVKFYNSTRIIPYRPWNFEPFSMYPRKVNGTCIDNPQWIFPNLATTSGSFSKSDKKVVFNYLKRAGSKTRRKID